MVEEKIFSVSVKAILVKGNKLLILKRPDNAESRGGLWEFPGGGLEFGEEPEAALIREIQEETGLDTEIVRPIYVWTVIKSKNKQVIGIHFLCRLFEKSLITLSHEHEDYAWVTTDEIADYDLCQCIKDDLKKFDLSLIIQQQSINK